MDEVTENLVIILSRGLNEVTIKERYSMTMSVLSNKVKESHGRF